MAYNIYLWAVEEIYSILLDQKRQKNYIEIERNDAGPDRNITDEQFIQDRVAQMLRVIYGG